MLEKTFVLMSRGEIAIPKEGNEKLIISLKTAWAQDYDLDKQESVENDFLDSLRLLLNGVHIVDRDDS